MPRCLGALALWCLGALVAAAARPPPAGPRQPTPRLVVVYMATSAPRGPETLRLASGLRPGGRSRPTDPPRGAPGRGFRGGIWPLAARGAGGRLPRVPFPGSSSLGFHRRRLQEGRRSTSGGAEQGRGIEAEGEQGGSGVHVHLGPPDIQRPVRQWLLVRIGPWEKKYLGEEPSHMQLGVPRDQTLSSWAARRERDGAEGSAHGGHTACKGCADMTMLLMGLQGPGDDGDDVD